jgi:hypothetical protein
MMQASSPRVPIFTPKALHDSLNDSLSALAFHASPPPSLTARFPIDGERPKPKVKIEEENRRSPPEVDADPEGAISSVRHYRARLRAIDPLAHTRTQCPR